MSRTGWLLAGVADAESIADHTTGVAVLALFLAECVNTDPVGQGLTHPLDVAAVTHLALIHDLAESVLTDLPKRAAARLSEQVKHDAEAAIIKDVLGALPNAPHYLELWRCYVDASTPEARLVKDVDKLEMVAQALRYSARGQRNLDEFWEGHRWFYPLCQQLYDSLLGQWLPG
ncbi:MAG: HD family hydrolase [Caldilineaceae bacterium]|nr:HD family hydrolase [Caldilineaceae bacterium]